MTAVATVVWDETMAEHEVQTSDVSEVVRRVDELDGRQRTLVTVYRGESHAACGGDAGAGLIVYVTFDNATFHQLVRPSEVADPSTAVVVAGGQSGSYEAKYVVDRVLAQQALTYFFENNALATDLNWEAK